MKDENSLNKLCDYLSALPKGAISDVDEVESLLAACWHEFAGSNAEGMAGYKLSGRMEDVMWEPPKLKFSIERHGGTVLGSTRANIHTWVVDIEQKTADCQKTGSRQLSPRDSRVDVRPIAKELGELILARQSDKRLKWRADGSVIVQIGEIFSSSGFAQTVSGRRRRFRKALEELLINAGWKRLRANAYLPPPA